LGKKIAYKSRNSCSVNDGGVGAHGQLTQGANVRNPRTKYKRSKNVLEVTSIAFYGCTPLYRTVTHFRAGSNRKSLYHHSTFAAFVLPWVAVG